MLLRRTPYWAQEIPVDQTDLFVLRPWSCPLTFPRSPRTQHPFVIIELCAGIQATDVIGQGASREGERDAAMYKG